MKELYVTNSFINMKKILRISSSKLNHQILGPDHKILQNLPVYLPDFFQNWSNNLKSSLPSSNHTLENTHTD